MSNAQANATFYFVDGTRLSIDFTRENRDSLAQIAADVKKGLAQETYSVEVDGDLLVIPRSNVKYLQISPAPTALPTETVRNGKIVS